jgi:hypothetical protein
MTNYKELVKQTAEKYGFNLEFKTKKILEANQYQVDLNIPLPDGTEVDIKAGKYQHMQILIECKGTDPSSCLILIKEPKQEYYNSRRHIIAHTHYAIAQYKPAAESDFYTFTGDFFNLKPNNKELKKSSTSDDNNNFYKAQLQIIEALNGISIRESAKNRLKASLGENNQGNYTRNNRCFLIPIIVTNANNIWVVDYTKDEVAVKPHKWALQKVRITNLISLEDKNGDKPYTISVAVVNISYLEQFIRHVENMVAVEGEINIGNSFLDEK